MLYNIISTPRSGSTLLLYSISDYLAVYSHTVAYNETIHWKNGYHNANLYSHISEIIQQSKDANAVIKNHVNVLDRHESMMVDINEPENLRAQWQEFKSLPVYSILSVRRNLIDQALSMAYAHTTNTWGYRKPAVIEQKSMIEDDTAKNAADILVKYYNSLYNKYLPLASEVVVYEDMGRYPRQVFSNLKLCTLAYEDLPPIEARQAMSPSKQDSIANIDYTTDLIKSQFDKNSILFPCENYNLKTENWKC